MSKDKHLHTVELPGGLIAHNVSDEAARILQARAAFVDKYFSEKGWDRKNFTMEQLLEVRAQEGWKNPL